MSSSTLTQAVSRALASSSSYSFGSLIKPDVRAIPKESMRGNVPPPLSQWVLQGPKFESLLLEQYQQIRPGDTKLLIAATGVGKTTKLPLQLAIASGKAGLVLLPDVVPIVITLKYVNDVVIPSFKQNVQVLPLRSEHVAEPKRGAVVYYSTAADFLPRFHADRGVIRRLNLDFIYMDEAHENHPAYHVMRILVGMGVFSDTKVFLGTATSAGTSLMLTGTANQVTPVACPSAQFTLQNPERTPMESPLYFAKITGRTMIFLPNDNTIDLWENYYDSCDIRVVAYRTFDTSTKIAVIQAMLKISGPLAFLTTKRLQTGSTFDIDCVVCGGYYEDLDVDYSVPAVSLQVKKVTKVMRTQRMGRVGRHMTGAAYYNDVTPSPPDPELTMVSAVYVWMWMRMFNIVMKNVEIAQFDDLLGEYSDLAISYLLCSRLHPILILPYLSERGRLFRGWDILRTVFCTNKEIEIDDESIDEHVELWSQLNTGPQTWLQAPETYRTKTIFPDEWQALPLVAWKAYLGQMDAMVMPDNLSVVSALVSGDRSRKKSVKVARADTVKSVAATVVSRPKSAMTTKVPDTPVWDKHDFPVITEGDESGVNETQTVVMSSFVRDRSAVRHVRAPSASTEEVQRTESIREWVNTSSPLGKRAKSHRSSNSSGSHDKGFISLRKVNAMDYRMMKLYPMDTLLLSQYLSAEAAHRSDYKNFDKLISLRENFSSLRGEDEDKLEKQNAFFLSVLRVHNNQVMERLQEKAAGEVRVPMFARMFGYDRSSTENLIKQSTRLLQGMQFEGFFVGVDKRTLHTSMGSTATTEAGKFAVGKATARYLLRVASPDLSAAVALLDETAVEVLQKTTVMGSAWRFGCAVVVPLHVFRDNRHAISGVVSYSNVSDDIVVLRGEEFNSKHPRLRGPVEREQVILVGIEPGTRDLVCIGPSVVFCVDDLWCVDRVLDFGYSGFILLSVEDFMVVGIYRGLYMEVSGVGYAHFISCTSFLPDLAKVYNK